MDFLKRVLRPSSLTKSDSSNSLASLSNSDTDRPSPQRRASTASRKASTADLAQPESAKQHGDDADVNLQTTATSHASASTSASLALDPSPEDLVATERHSGLSSNGFDDRVSGASVRHLALQRVQTDEEVLVSQLSDNFRFAILGIGDRDSAAHGLDFSAHMGAGGAMASMYTDRIDASQQKRMGSSNAASAVALPTPASATTSTSLFVAHFAQPPAGGGFSGGGAAGTSKVQQQQQQPLVQGGSGNVIGRRRSSASMHSLSGDGDSSTMLTFSVGGRGGESLMTGVGGSTFVVNKGSMDGSPEVGPPPVRTQLGKEHAISLSEVEVFYDQILGAGQFSTVYRGKFRGMTCAVKILERSMNEELETFGQELSVIAALSHPNVVRYYGGSCTPPDVFVVQEPLSSTLSDFLYGPFRQPLTPRGILSIGLDIAQGLNYIHHLQPPIIHRDLKPDSIMLDAHGVAKISHFGLSRSKYSSCIKTARHSAGTLAYMAPECFDVAVGRLTEQCDVFSFGIVMWELCAGKQPWQGVKAHDFLQRMVVDDARLPMSFDDNVCPMALRNIITSCWCTDPTDRPTCSSIVSELERMLKYCPK